MQDEQVNIAEELGKERKGKVTMWERTDVHRKKRNTVRIIAHGVGCVESAG
jgi:hypothetical protein